MSSEHRQATLRMTGESHILEHGPDDRYGGGGVYDGAGEFDLDATEELLAERFEAVSERLPDQVGEYERQHTPKDYNASYYREGPFEGRRGLTTTDLYVRIFPVGPNLHRWTVGLEERQEKYATNPENGWGSRHHPDASNCDDPGAAVATALALMRGEISLNTRSSSTETEGSQ